MAQNRSQGDGISGPHTMHHIRKILVPTDFSACAQSAFLHAVHLARYYESELFLIHVSSQEGYERISTDAQLADASSDSHLFVLNGTDLVFPSHLVQGIETHRQVIWAHDVAGSILDFSLDHDIDLIVMGAHGDTAANRFLICGLESLLVGNVAEEVVRLADQPVLTVGLRSGRQPDMIKRILVPVDRDLTDESTVQYARELAYLYESRLDFLCSVDDSILLDRSNGAVYEVCETHRREMESILTWIPGPDVPVAYHAVCGPLTEHVSRFAEQNDVQLIVLSAKGIGWNEHFPHDTDRSVYRMATFSVLTVKSNHPERLPWSPAGAKPEVIA